MEKRCTSLHSISRKVSPLLTSKRPYLKSDFLTTGNLTPGYQSHKGFLCPKRSLCVEQDNPYNGTVSFDNIFQSLELVFVIMSSNTFSDLMYDLTDSEFLVAALCRSPKSSRTISLADTP